MGGGASSLFWASEAKSLITIEDNKQWYTSICSFQQKNQEIFLKQDAEYFSFPTKLSKKFDVIIIDGSYRNECAKITKNILDIKQIEGAMIILDNSDWLYKTAQYLRKQDLIEIKFHGFAPINPYTHTTSIFLTRNFNFPLKNEKENYSISSLHHIEGE